MNPYLHKNQQPVRVLRRRKQIPRTRKYVKVGRNDPCPCRSGLKFKQCCMSATEENKYA